MSEIIESSLREAILGKEGFLNNKAASWKLTSVVYLDQLWDACTPKAGQNIFFCHFQHFFFSQK